MTTVSEPRQSGFRLSQLVYDTRYRSLTIQIFAMILLVLALSWLVSNTIQNLEALGKDFDFGFLGQPAGYDINQMLIPYENRMSHGRAALVGILNTVLVAFLGCIAATIIGTIAGVLRLSKNWIVSRLMTAYVESFRNVPLLLWIILIFAVLTESTPQPRDFRSGAAEMILGDSVAITNRGTYLPELVFTRSLAGNDIVAPPSEDEPAPQAGTAPAAGTYGGSRIATGGAGPAEQAGTGAGTSGGNATATAAPEGGTVIPSASVADWLLILGVLAASIAGIRAIGARATRKQEATGVRPRALPWQLAVFFVPIGAVLIALGATFEYPEVRGFNFDGGIHLRNSLLALWLALSLYTGAFIAEIVRGGILAISTGQTEAAFALGLRPSRTMNLVILPQAMRVIVPPLISQFLNLTKNSSLAIAVGYMDARATLGGITINQTGRELEGMLLLGLFYLVLSLIISSFGNLYNASVKLKER